MNQQPHHPLQPRAIVGRLANHAAPARGLQMETLQSSQPVGQSRNEEDQKCVHRTPYSVLPVDSARNRLAGPRPARAAARQARPSPCRPCWPWSCSRFYARCNLHDDPHSPQLLCATWTLAPVPTSPASPASPASRASPAKLGATQSNPA
jgi:hypothetical protein